MAEITETNPWLGDKYSITNNKAGKTKDNNFSRNISGFYYDQQLENPVLRVSLHPNTVYSKEGSTAEEKWKHVDHPEETVEIPEVEMWKYSTIPIAVALCNEDFSVDIVNEWTNFGDDPIGAMWNQNKASAPYMREFAKGLSDISSKTKSYLNDPDGNLSKVSRGAFELIEALGDFGSDRLETQARYLSRALIVKGTRFSYYSGTGIAFGNLIMKFTLFPKWEGSTFVSVIDQIQGIMPYIIGDYIDVTELGTKGVGEFVKEFASWQLPPGGFEAELKDVDIVQKGTLKLRFGTFYALDNLVINNCNFTFSKTMVKNPSSKTGPDLTPMYCDVTLSLRPITKYSKEKLIQFIDAKTDPATKSYLEQVNKNIGQSLKQTKNKINNDLRTHIQKSGDKIIL
jgi:hypothetical protein